MSEERMSIETARGEVSAALTGRGGAPVLVLAHGAGGSLDAPLLAGFAEGLSEEGIACLRFNFPYREQGRRAPDREPVLRETWTAARAAADDLGDRVLVGGGSMGGRIASMAVADGMPAAGLLFLAYPLHPPGHPERIRDAHLPRIRVPMLFLQGTNDAFARPDLLEATIARLGDLATLHAVEGADHSFRARGRRDPAATGRSLAPVAARWIASHA